MVASASTLEVRRISPSGIILIRAATVLVTATSVVVSGTRKRAQRRRAPIGIRAKEMYLTILFMIVKSLELAVLIVWAVDSSLLIKLSAPTAVTTALQVPETTKLPEVSLSPGCLVILSASPVIKASLTSMLPETTLLSTRIWSPRDSTIRSPSTMSVAGIWRVLPFLTTAGFCSATRRILSIVFLARISLMMLIRVFAIAIKMKRRCL